MSIYTKNRKAYYEYEIIEDIEVGLVLEGWMVKAIYANRFNFESSYVLHKNGELFCIGLNLRPLEESSNVVKHLNKQENPTIKLLIKKKELDKWVGQVGQKGMTMVPLSLYSTKGRKKNRFILKMKIGLAKGKKNHEKKQVKKEKDIKKLSDREMKTRKIS